MKSKLTILWTLTALLGGAAGAQADDFRVVYVPIEDLDVLFSSKKGVLLTRREFFDLWRQSHPEGADPSTPLSDAFVTQGDYTARLGDKSLIIEGELKITKQTPGWQAVPLSLAGVSIASALVGDQPAQLALDGQGRPTLFLKEKGDHVLRLKLSAPTGEGDDAHTACFRLPSAPGTLTVEAPEDFEVRVADVKVVKSADENRYIVPLGGRGDLALTVARSDDEGERNVLVVARGKTTINVTPSQADWREDFSVSVYARPIETLNVRVPVGLQVVEVETPGLGRWDAAEQADHTLLTVEYQSGWTGQRALTIEAIGAPQLDEPWTIPHARVQEATVQTGSLHVHYDDSLGLEVRAIERAQRVSPDNAADPVLDVAYWRPDFDAQVVMRPKVRKTAVSTVTLINVARTRLELSAGIDVEPRNGSLFDTVLSLDEGWYVTSVQYQNAELEFAAEVADGRTNVRLKFPQPVPAGQIAQLTLRADRAPSDWLGERGVTSQLPLTTVTVQDADEVEGMLLLRAPDEVRVQATELQGLESVPTATVPDADDRVRLALEHRTAEVSGTLQATRRIAQISVEAHAAVRFGEQQLEADYAVTYRIKGGTTDELTFELPVEDPSRVQVRLLPGPIGLASQVDEALGQGRHRWRLRLTGDVTQPVTVLVHIEQPRNADGPTEYPVLSVEDAVRQSGTIAVEGELDQQLEVFTSQMRSIDPGELPTVPGHVAKGRLVGSYQYRRLPYVLRLDASKHEEGSVLTAICRHATLVSVIDGGGFVRHQATFQIDNTGLQNLELTLPEDAKLLSAQLNGQPREVRRNDDQYLIALPAGNQGTVNLKVEIHYQHRFPRLGLLTTFSQQPPELNVPVLKLDWSVYFPDGKVVVRSDGSISPTNPLERPTILGALRKALTPRGGRRIFNPLMLPAAFDARRFARREAAVSNRITQPTAAFETSAEAIDEARPSDSRLSLRERTPQATPARPPAAAQLGREISDEAATAIDSPQQQPNPPTEPESESMSGRRYDAPQRQGNRMFSKRKLGEKAEEMTDLNALPNARRQMPINKELFVTERERGQSGQQQSERGGVQNRARRRGDSAGDASVADPFGRSAGAQEEARAAQLSDQFESGDRNQRGVNKNRNGVFDFGAQTVGPTGALGGGNAGQGGLSGGAGFGGGGARWGYTPEGDRFWGSTKSQGLLSLSMAMEPVGTKYQFTGLRGDGELHLSVQDDVFCNSFLAVIALGLVTVGWIARRRSRTLRAILVTVPLGVAIGLSGLVPLSWLFVLDGLFVGAVVLCILYTVRGAACWAGNVTHRWEASSAAKSAAVLISLSFACQSVAAAEPVQKAPPASGQTSQEKQLPTVYVPYDPKTDPLKSDKVYLTQKQYETLWNLAHPDEVILPDPKVRGFASQVRISGRIDGEVARFTLSASLWSFRDDWVAVSLPVAEVVFSQVLVDEKAATLAGPQATRQPVQRAKKKRPAKPRTVFPVVFVKGRGAHSVSAQFDVPVKRLGATGDLRLQLAPVGAAELELELPEKGLDVRTSNVAGGWQLDGKTFRAAVNRGGVVGVHWQPPSSRRAAALLASVHHSSWVIVETTGLRRLSTLDYQIRQGAVRELLIDVPNPVLVRDVSGPEVDDWFLTDADGDRRLHLRTKRPLSSATTVSLDLFFPFGAQRDLSGVDVTFPAIVPRGVNRETGTLAVIASPDLKVGIKQSTGLVQIDRQAFQGAKLDGDVASWPRLAAYRYATRPFRLQFNVAVLEGKLTSNVLSAVTIDKQRVKLRSDIHLSQTGRPLVSERIHLPKDFILDAVNTPDNVRWSLIPSDDAVIIEFEQAGLKATQTDASTVKVTVEGRVPRDPEATTLDIPAVDVPGSVAQRGMWAIFLAPGLDAETVAISNLRTVEPSTSHPPMLRATLIDALTVAPRLVYRQEGQPASLTLGLRKLTPQVTATTVTAVSVREVAVAFVSRIEWTINRAGVRTLQFVAPAWLGEDLDVDGSGVRQIESSLLDNDRRLFTVSLGREVMGLQALHVVQTHPLPEDNLITAPRLTATGVESERQFVVLENLSPDQLDRLEDDQLRLETLEVERVPVKLADSLKNRAIEVVRFLSPQGQLAWRMRSSEQIEALSASVNLADLVMVVEKDGRYRIQVNYRVTNRSEQFLAVQLPADAQIWSLYVAGEPSRPAVETRDNQQVYLIPLPKTAAGDFSSKIQLVYTGSINETAGWVRRWDLPAPSVVDVRVAKTQWTVYLPRDFNYNVVKTNMEETEAAYRTLNYQASQLDEAFQLVTQGNFGKGAARSRALDNLNQLNLITNEDPIESSKSQQLLQRNTSQTRQLEQAIQELNRKKAPAEAASKKVQLDSYFYKQPEVKKRPAGAPASDKKSSGKPVEGKASPQAVRSRLKMRVQSQVQNLNRMASELDEQREQQQQAQQRESKDAEQPPGNALGQTAQSGPATNFSIPVTQSSLPMAQQAFDDDAGRVDGVAREPTRKGGLSLEIDVPLLGEPLYFSKASGGPALSLQVFPAKAGQWGVASVWLIASLAVALSIGWWVGRSDGWTRLLSHWRGLLFVFSLIWWFLLPYSAIGFVLWLVSLCCLLFFRRTPVSVAR